MPESVPPPAAPSTPVPVPPTAVPSTPVPVPPPAAPTPDPVPTAAFSAGWLVARLHQPLSATESPSEGLKTIAELVPADRVELYLERLEKLLAGPLARVVAPLSTSPQAGPAAKALDTSALRARWNERQGNDTAAFGAAVGGFHVELLTRLTVGDRQYGSAYSLGQSLCDTCSPKDLPSLEAGMSKSRLSRIQAWLATLSACLPSLSATAVSQGLDHWAAWLQVHPDQVDNSGNGSPESQKVIDAIRAQGEHWRSLLAGERNASSLLTPEAYVAAGEAALQRGGVIARRIIVHFWWAVLIIVLATAGTIVVALRNTQGAAKLWGVALSLLASLGITGTSVRSIARQLTTQAGRTLFNLEEADAIGWAVTYLPAISPSRSQQRQLRRAGVEPPRVT